MNKKVEKSDFKTEAEKCARDIIDWMIKHELWIDTVILDAQGDLVLLRVKGDDVHIHGVADLADLRRSLSLSQPRTSFKTSSLQVPPFTRMTKQK